jgi:hypothetical protein
VTVMTLDPNESNGMLFGQGKKPCPKVRVF